MILSQLADSCYLELGYHSRLQYGCGALIELRQTKYFQSVKVY